VILNEERTTELERRAIHDGRYNEKIVFISLLLDILARKYAALKKVRHCRTGKQHSLDDDEEDIGTYEKSD
jgi:hypothetical protein